MDFTNEFTVDAPLATVWEFMLDAEQVAPCVPGAAITEQVDQTNYRGTVKVKLGAVQMSYRGEMEMVPNESDRTIVLHAKGRETRGSGGASGTVTSRLVEMGESQTRVEIRSQIDVTGKVAQFGRGIMQDVANRLIKDFARCLEQKITASTSSPPSSGEQESAGAAPAPDPDTASTTPAASPGAMGSGTPTPEAAPRESSRATAGTVPASTNPPAPSTGVVSTPQSGQGQNVSGAIHDTQSGGTAGSRAGTGSANPPPEGASELSISQLLVDVFRSRAAGWLRSAAKRIEPK